AARTGTAGWGHLNVERSDPASAAHRLLGSCTEADVGPAPAAPCRGALWRLGGTAGATPHKALPPRTLTKRRSGPPQTSEGKSGALRHALGSISTALFHRKAGLKRKGFKEEIV